MKQTDNESPAFTDITGDGKPEIVCSVNGVFGYASPNPDKPTEEFTWHPISPEGATGGKFTHGMGVGDVNGDGRLDLLEKGRWWEQPESLEGDPVWKSHRTDFSGGGGAQMYAYDFDNDGDNDVLTSLAAHAYGLAWYEQMTEDGRQTLKQRLIMGKDPMENKYGLAFSQMHGIAMADIDGDGIEDIITGKRYWAHGGKDPGGNDPAVLYWFRVVRKQLGSDWAPFAVDFVPYKIDDDSGVGTEVNTADMNGDGLLDIIVGNKKGAFIHFQKRKKVDKQAYLDAQPMKAFLDGMKSMDEYATGLAPPAAAEAMTLPEGFTATLIAAEPDLVQPVTFCFDERGRIWVAEANDYPFPPEPGEEGSDRILIFEDADHDGTFETRKVFADGLSLISGMELGFGGVWVGAAPYLLFIPDRDRDDVPDGEPEILLDGWSVRDTHETHNSFSWGPDGWLYGLHGVFNPSLVGKPGAPPEERTHIDCAVWRYHPVRHEFEIFAHGTSNPWGLDFDQYGQAFITACVIPHLWHMVQGGYYERQGGQHQRKHLYELIPTIARHRHFTGATNEHAMWGDRRNLKNDVMQDSIHLAGGGHAHCGLTIYRGGAFPDRYDGALLMFNLHGHRINWDFVQRQGSNYYGDRRPDFMFSNDHWFVGTHLDYGPDGALYFTDWHDDTTCHRRDDLEWDRTNGRLFRIHYGEYKAVKVDLSKATDEELFDIAITHENEWFARTARRLLQERKSLGTLRELPRIILDSDGTRGYPIPWPVSHASKILEQNGGEEFKVRALFALHACGLSTYRKQFNSDSEYVRAWMIGLSGEQGDESPSPLNAPVLQEKVVEMAATDESAFVRRHLASLIPRVHPQLGWRIGESLSSRAEDANDPLIPLLIWYGIEPLVAEDPARGFQLAKTTKIPKLRDFIFRRAAAAPGGREIALSQIGKSDVALAEIVVSALAAQLKDEARVPMPVSWPKVYEVIQLSSNSEAHFAADFLGAKFGDTRRFPDFRHLLTSADTSVEMRSTALTALVDGRDGQTVNVLHKIVAERLWPDRTRAISSLASINNPATAKVLIDAFPNLSQIERAAAITTLTSRKEMAQSLIAAVADGSVPRTEVSVVAARQILQFDDEQLTASLEEHWGKIKPASADKAGAIAAWKKKLTPAELAKANLGNGRRVFNQTCFACHTMFGQGIAIGPDITGADRSDLNYVLENILDPNNVVPIDYQLTVFTMKDDSVLSGMIRREGQTAVTVALPGGAETNVIKANIAKRETLPQSLMPEGILDALPEADARDLIAYLQSEKQVRIAQAGEIIIEGETMKVLKHTGNPRPQDMAGFKLDQWSGDSHLWWTGAKPGDSLVLEFEVPEDGNYEMNTMLTKARDYGQVRLALDGPTNFILEQVDLYEPAPRVVSTGVLSLGERELKAGKHQLIVDILGKNPKADPGFMFGLDYLQLLKK
ncbi:MAG: PVC-type heme-binding CxxCH protein [Verrucomicrobiota bacterium]